MEGTEIRRRRRRRKGRIHTYQSAAARKAQAMVLLPLLDVVG
jgi:hypothetical protein